MLFSAVLVTSFHFLCSKATPINININPEASEPQKLLLTPLIKAGRLTTARQVSFVKNLNQFGLPNEIPSYSGFFTVDEGCGSNIFFWFFPSAYSPESAPLILWHGGGPGTSGLGGLFTEFGPFFVAEDDQLHLRSLAWTLTRSVIFVDSPVGTGLSETSEDREECLVKDVGKNAQHVLEMMLQFFQVFPEFRKNELYVFTGSYGGKFAPAIAYEMHNQNQKKDCNATDKVNLKGLVIASGFMDPISQIDYGDFYYSHGLIDEGQREGFRSKELEAKHFINQGNYSAAFDLVEPLIIGLGPFPSLLNNLTGIGFPFNMLKPYNKAPNELLYHTRFLNKFSVRDALHVDYTKKYSSLSSKVYQNFKDDIYRSVKPQIEQLLDSGLYRMLFVGSQMDLVVPPTTVANFVHSLNWKGEESFRAASQKQFYAPGNEGQVTAYFKGAANGLYYLFIRNSGHLWIVDKPEVAYKVMTDFTLRNIPFL